MKLANRPGLDFKATFNEFADRSLNKKVNRIVEREGRMSNDEKAEYSAKVRADLKENLTLSKEEMSNLLVEMGIVMKSHQMRTLVDAFDADGDGVVTLKEFIAFTGSKRDRHGGALQAMSSAKCCWLTTCMVTGMPNAYSVSNLTKQAQRDVDRGVIQPLNETHTRTMQIRKEIQNKQYSDSCGDRDRERDRDGGSRSSRCRGGERGGERGGDDNDSYADKWDNDDKTTNISISSSISNVAGRTVIREMKNGEKRMCIELKERIRREDILIKLGAISNLKDNKNESKDQEGDDNDNEHDNYDDDFDDG